MQANEAVRIEQEYKAVKKSAGLMDFPTRIGKIYRLRARMHTTSSRT